MALTSTEIVPRKNCRTMLSGSHFGLLPVMSSLDPASRIATTCALLCGPTHIGREKETRGMWLFLSRADAGTKQGHRHDNRADWTAVHREPKRKHSRCQLCWD